MWELAWNCYELLKMEHDPPTSIHYSVFSNTILVKQVDTKDLGHASPEFLVRELMLPSNHFSTFHTHGPRNNNDDEITNDTLFDIDRVGGEKSC